MKSSKVLEMLKQNRIEELMPELKDEIFTESLKGNTSAKKRYAAMKRYLKTISESRPILTKPCEVEFEGRKYNSFTNTYSLALTNDTCGEIEMCDEPERYPDVTRLIPLGGEENTFDFRKVLAEAKSQGYKYTKTAIHSNDFLMRYRENYFRIGLVDVTYGILDDGEETAVYFNGHNRPLTIKTEFGCGLILPIRYESAELDGVTVVEV